VCGGVSYSGFGDYYFASSICIMGKIPWLYFMTEDNKDNILSQVIHNLYKYILYNTTSTDKNVYNIKT